MSIHETALRFDGEKTEARGRNGWFKIRRATVWGFRAAEDGPAHIWVDFWSARPARAAPAQVRMTTDEARSLARMILAQADEAEEALRA